MSTPRAAAADTESAAKPVYGNAFSIDENQSFFWQQTPQVRYNGAIAANGSVLVDSRAHLLRQIDEQVRCIADAQFFNVCRAIRVHRIWPDLFCGGNVRASDDDPFHFGGCARCRLSGNVGSDQQVNADSRD